MTDRTPLDRSLLEERFRVFFRTEFDYVWSSLRRLGVREADLEDLTHDVFMVVHRRLPDYDPQKPVKPWLFGITFRTASEYRRRRMNRNELLVEVRERTTSHLADDLADRDLVLAALERVEIERRAVFLLHELDGCSMPEIAEALGIPLNTGYSRLRLAKEEFAQAVRALSKVGGAA